LKDIVIIGSGLAGSLLCNELVKHVDVTLLERGPKDSIQIPHLQFIKKKLAEVPTFCFGGGGTTSLWHNGLIPINTEDVNSKDFRDILTDAQQYMDQAASDLFFKNGSLSAEYQKLVAEVNAVSGSVSAFPHGIDCLIYPKKFKKLTTYPGIKDIYNVKNINFVFEGARLKAVSCSAGGRQHLVSADIFVISAGGLGTPGILQKIIDASGNAYANVGLGFIDHPMGFVGKVKFKKNIALAIKKLCSCDKGKYVGRSAVRLKSECGRFTGCAYFRPALTMTNKLELYKFKSALGAGRGIARLKRAFSLKIFHPDILAEIFAHLFGFNIPSRTYNILFIGEQKRGNNRVYYDGKELVVDWSITDEELSIYRDMLNSLKEMLTGLADEINIKTDITEDWLWSAAHHSGTVSMGDADEDLIDKDLKLKCLENVYVCDGSIIQEHSYTNTGLTIGMLALRLADRLREEVT
jgi:hypothetical protein